MAEKLISKIPEGPLSEKWTKHKSQIRVVSPGNKRKLEVIVIGTGLGGASAAASLGELGYNVVFLMLERERRVLSAHELVSYIEKAGSNPTPGSQYLVVWGDRQGATGLCRDIDYSAFVRPFKNVRNRTTGRYYSIPK